MSQHTAEIVRAGEKLAHRGPDDYGSYSDDFFGAYVRRLSILDTSPAGHQPMTLDGGRLVIAFNGEIYNYGELRDFLEARGHALASHCDTEVVLRLYEELGDSCVTRLRGMFAFVIWKRDQRELVAVRDRLGIKPLYLFQDAGRTIVASEIKSILDLAPQSRTPDRRSIFKYLARGWVDDSIDTFFERIKAVPQSTLVRISGGGTRATIYWSLSVGEGRPFDAEEFRGSFSETVSRHLQSDVPVAALLSGGMDSASIVGTASQVTASPIKAFSAVLGTGPGGAEQPDGSTRDPAAGGYKTGLDESLWIDQTVRHTGVRHEYLAYNGENFAEAVESCLRVHDEPFQESDCVYSYLLHRDIASRGYKVLLVGEGGDEVLGGYSRLIFPYLYSLRVEEHDEEFSRALHGAQDLLTASREAILERLNRYGETLARRESGQENTSAYRLLDPAFTQEYRDIVQEPANPTSTGEYSNYFFAHLAKHIFQRDLPYHLRLTDRNAMAHGIEARPPMLDHTFMELVFSYDFSEFMRNGVNKAMLREAMRPYLPAAVVDRSGKEGRPGNPAHLVYRVLHDELRQLLAAGGIPRFLKADCLQIFERDQEATNMERALVWFRIYVLMKWLSLHDETASFS